MSRILSCRFTAVIGAVLVILGTDWLFKHPFEDAHFIVGLPLAGFIYLLLKAGREAEEEHQSLPLMPEPKITIEVDEGRGGLDVSIPFGGTETEANEIADWVDEMPPFAVQRLRERKRFARLVND